MKTSHVSALACREIGTRCHASISTICFNTVTPSCTAATIRTNIHTEQGRAQLFWNTFWAIFVNKTQRETERNRERDQPQDPYFYYASMQMCHFLFRNTFQHILQAISKTNPSTHLTKGQQVKRARKNGEGQKKTPSTVRWWIKDWAK